MDDIQRIARVSRALNESEVTWWADHGTLLGLIREGRLLPWDHDIDLSLHGGELDSAFRAIQEIKPFLHAHLVRTARNIKILPYDGSGRVVDIGAYFPGEDGHLEKTLIMFPRTEGLSFGAYRRFAWRQARRVEWMLRKVGPFFSDTPGVRSLFGALHLWAFCRITHFREGFGVEAVSRVPSKYLAERGTLDWHELALPIPAAPSAYLRYRYGADWTVPRRSWSWWLDDQSI